MKSRVNAPLSFHNRNLHVRCQGEPIVKPMAFAFSKSGFETIKDQFMLGDNILVAPVVENGARSRKVVFPEGKWKGDDGSIITGGKSVEIQVPLKRLPYFRFSKITLS